LENLKERDNSENLDVDERIILEYILGKYSGKVDHNMDLFWAVVNTAINPRAP
jgi:hypothetical protein